MFDLTSLATVCAAHCLPSFRALVIELGFGDARRFSAHSLQVAGGTKCRALQLGVLLAGFGAVFFASAANIAPSGTAYGWSGLTASTANAGRVTQPGINDNNLNADVDLNSAGDKVNAWEAAGIIWTSASSITTVSFINGTVTGDGDGFLTANCTLQFSTDGTTWSNSGWAVSPTYPNSALASGRTYTFSGPAVSGVRGARVVGQVRSTDTSYHWIVKELQVTGSSSAATTFAITAAAGANGSISPNGSVTVNQGANQPFTITPAAGFVVASVTVDGANVGAVTSYTFSNVQGTHTISAAFSPASTGSNIALNGTAYGWSGLTSSTANTGRVVQPGLNDNNLSVGVDLNPAGDTVNAWEAAGIVWPTTSSVAAVSFINGNVTSDGDGFLTANCTLQFSTDGTAWTNSGWALSPAYPNSASASGKTYTFSGTAVSGIRGARVVGQVRSTDTSYHWIVKEVQVTGGGSTGTTFALTASAGSNGTITPSGTINVARGATQSFAITPNSGYVVSSVTVDGSNVGAVMNYTFTNVQAAHVIRATFTPTTTPCSAPPAIPTGLVSPSQTSTSVNLSWSPVSTPNGCIVSYNVYRGGSLAAAVSAPNALITGLSPATAYSFTVAASDAAGTSAPSSTLSVTTQPTSSGGNFTAAQVLAGVQAAMTGAKQVNTQPHINTMTRARNVNVYQVVSGVYAYASGMAIDTDGSDPDPDPDHQGQTTWTDNSGAPLGSHRVPYYVLGDDCFDRRSPCPHFYYVEHAITGLQFALIFYNGRVTGAVFGDTQGTDITPTSNNDSRELGEASVKAAINLGIPSSGTTGGVENGVTVVIFSGPQWVVRGTNNTLDANAQAMVQRALNTLGSGLGL